MIFGIAPGHWVGTPLLMMVFPLAYLLIKAPGANRPFLYYIQAGLMLIFIILLFFVDFVFQYDFRQTQWMVISFVTLYFAAMGGIIGVASLAGRAWTISSVILFFIAAILAFVQRAVTGY
jgi:Ca2+/Na+ antiporter